MNWVEQEHQSRTSIAVTDAREKILNEEKAKSFPVIAKETATGDKPVDPIQFQPVRSPGLFEAEFAKRGNDVIFHFWPWGLHEADRLGKPRPGFQPGFKRELQAVFTDQTGSQGLDIEDDRDMGAYFVKVKGLGAKLFWRDLSIKIVTALHKGLGGE